MDPGVYDNFTDNSSIHTADPISASITAFFCLIGVWANVIVLLVILPNPKLRTPCFTLIAGGAIGFVLYCTAGLITTLSTLGALSGLWSLTNRTRLICIMVKLYLPLFIGGTYCPQAAVFVAFDRLSCIFIPVWHRRCGQRFALIGFTLCALCAIAQCFIMLLASGPLYEIIPSCMNYRKVLGSVVMDNFPITNLVLYILCVLTYAVILIGGEFGRWKLVEKIKNGSATTTERNLYMKQQSTILPAAKMLLMIHLIVGVGPELIYILQCPLILRKIARPVHSLASLAEIVSLVIRCKQFRKGIRRLFRCTRRRRLSGRIDRRQCQVEVDTGTMRSSTFIASWERSTTATRSLAGTEVDRRIVL